MVYGSLCTRRSAYQLYDDYESIAFLCFTGSPVIAVFSGVVVHMVIMLLSVCRRELFKEYARNQKNTDFEHSNNNKNIPLTIIAGWQRIVTAWFSSLLYTTMYMLR